MMRVMKNTAVIFFGRIKIEKPVSVWCSMLLKEACTVRFSQGEDCRHSTISKMSLGSSMTLNIYSHTTCWRISKASWCAHCGMSKERELILDSEKASCLKLNRTVKYSPLCLQQYKARYLVCANIVCRSSKSALPVKWWWAFSQADVQSEKHDRKKNDRVAEFSSVTQTGHDNGFLLGHAKIDISNSNVDVNGLPIFRHFWWLLFLCFWMLRSQQSVVAAEDKIMEFNQEA